MCILEHSHYETDRPPRDQAPDKGAFRNPDRFATFPMSSRPELRDQTNHRVWSTPKVAIEIYFKNTGPRFSGP